jgi:hypothetical protein
MGTAPAVDEQAMNGAIRPFLAAAISPRGGRRRHLSKLPIATANGQCDIDRMR